MDVGDVLAARYELVEEVGRGGMGRVVRAHDRTLDRTVAVKLLAPHLLGDAAAVDALRAEARTAAAVRHPNVVQVLDAVLEETDQPAIVMEYVDGPSLREVVPDGGLDVERALAITAAVAAGLEAVHGAGLVHRDLSPGNVLLDRGVPRLTDFGIARSAAATATTTVRGSVGYLAPEQASGGRVGAPADVYGLACLATMLLTGRPPFDADQPVGVVHQHLHEPPPDVRQRRPGVPATVAAALAAGLSKDPGARPQTAAAFVTALGLAPNAVTVAQGDARPAPGAGAAGAGAAALAVTEVQQPEHGTLVLDGRPADPDPVPSADAARRWSLVTAAAAVLAVGALAATIGLLREDDPEQTAEPEVAVAPSPVPTSPAAPASEPSPAAPEPAPRQPPAEAAAAGLQDLRALLVDLRERGALGAGALGKLDERAANAIAKLRAGDPNAASKELRELRKELAGRAGKGQVDQDAETAILTELLAIETALDAVPRGEGQGRGDDEDRDDEGRDDQDDD